MNAIPSCKDCKYQSKSMAYPLLRCNQLGGLVAPTYRCANFKPETK